MGHPKQYLQRRYNSLFLNNEHLIVDSLLLNDKTTAVCFIFRKMFNAENCEKLLSNTS